MPVQGADAGTRVTVSLRAPAKRWRWARSGPSRFGLYEVWIGSLKRAGLAATIIHRCQSTYLESLHHARRRNDQRRNRENSANDNASLTRSV